MRNILNSTFEEPKAAERWVRAVNADGRYGRWHYEMEGKVEEIEPVIGAIPETVATP